MGLVSLLVLTGVGLFLSRGAILRHIAGSRLESVSRRYGLAISYEKLSMPSFTTVLLEGLSVVPLQRDTLLKVGEAEVRLDFFPLLGGRISVNQVTTDGVEFTFIKHHGISNYDFLFRKPRGSKSETAHVEAAGYNLQVEKTLNLLFRLLPENGEFTDLLVIGQRDSLITSFRIPEVRLQDSHFSSEISVEEGEISNKWQVYGMLKPDEKVLEGRISSAGKEEAVILPYIGPHYNAVVKFDSIAFSLSASRSSSSCETLQGVAAVNGLEVYHPALSVDTIDLNQGKLDYKVHVGVRSLELDSASTVVFNRLDFHPYIYAEKTGRWHFKASVHRPEFPAENLFASLPSGLFSHVQGIEASGNLTYNLNLDIDFNNLENLEFSSDLNGYDFYIEDWGTGNLSRMNDEFEYTAYEKDRPVRTFAVGPSNPNFRSLNQISPLLQIAVLQSEDGSFFYHQGFYPGAVQEALAYDLEVGRFARGGSSITMQLVKNVFLNRHKNIARKLEEALIVWLIEGCYLTSKERMYEVYMNIIEWGPMVYGACEAARFYFDKEPSDLTISESIFLASIIPKPKWFRSVFNPDVTLKENQLGYYRLIASRLAAKGLLTEEEAETFVPQVEITGPARDLILSPDTVGVSVDSLFMEDAEARPEL